MRNYDVVVVGGGVGGFAAAVAAARCGASVLLVERYGFLGGMATAGLVNPFMPFELRGKPLVGGVLLEVVNRLKSMHAYDPSTRAFDPEAMKRVLEEIALDSGVELLYHTCFVKAEVEKGFIQSLLLHGKEGLFKVRGVVYVDGTGDGDVAASAGAPFQKGRPEDGLTLPLTLNFDLANVDLDQLPSREEINNAYREAKRRGEITCPRENVLWFYTVHDGVVHFNTTRVLGVDATSSWELTKAEIEGRRQMYEIVAWLKKTFPAFKRAYVVRSGVQIGVRETRRVIGEYILKEEDILSARKFPDPIARSNYPIDIHNPAGEGTIIKHPPPGEYYEIPYRCIVPLKVENLLIGCRCISATHAAHSATRIMPTVMAIGQAAGAAAALCAKLDVAPRKLNYALLRSELTRQGAVV